MQTRKMEDIIMKKKVLVSILTASMMVVSLAGCGDNRKSADTESAESATETAAEESTADAATEETSTEEATDASTEEASDETATAELFEGEYTIGISQFAEHGSLDNCREGFIEGLAQNGFVEGENLTIQFQNAQADTATASQISDTFVSDNVNLICAIATPSAMSAYNSAKDTEIPVIYSAVSDPVGAELASEDGTPVGNITGTSDALAVTEQLEMIREILPDATKIGIIYTTSEANSVSTIEEYKKYAADYGFEIVDTGINTLADLDMAASDLVSKVDCINNLTDNTVVSGLQTVITAANDAGIPVFGSEVEQVKVGCVASMGLDYYQLGIQTGEMAASVLKGEVSASELEYQVIDEPSLYVNTAAADKIGLTLDEELVGTAAETYDTITVE
jgi:putative ABC transport system substrate-binding protein